MLSSWREKPLVISLSKWQFPFWSPRSLSCCQKREAVRPQLWSCVRPRPNHVRLPPLTGRLWRGCRGRSWQARFSRLMLSLQLCSLLCVMQEKAGRGRCKPLVGFLPRHPLPVLCNGSQVTEAHWEPSAVVNTLLPSPDTSWNHFVEEKVCRFLWSWY